MDLNQILQIVWLIVILSIVWIVLRFVLKLAAKVFSCGCGAILLIGLLVFLFRYFTNS
jgi:hypothetical protein